MLLTILIIFRLTKRLMDCTFNKPNMYKKYLTDKRLEKVRQ